jgi:hypothetical protein
MGTSTPAQRPEFLLRLRALPDRTPPVIRLRRLLKALLRCYGFRAVEVRELPPENDVGTGGPAATAVIMPRSAGRPADPRPGPPGDPRTAYSPAGAGRAHPAGE